MFGARGRSHRPGLLHDAAEHHQHPVRHFGDDAHVVGDQQHGHAVRDLQPLDQARISACVVTSSAVVGSSAISSRGPHASAMAIIARCRMPPENSKG